MEDDLLQIQQELQAVKKALKGGGSFLGMKDVTLQRYLLQLSEKENLVMSRQFNLGDVQAGGVVAGGVADLKPARPPPPGEKRTFDKESVESVTAHMRDYESDVKDCALTLRALSALAYANASVVSEDALGIALRLGQLHPKENAVQLALVRLLCNAAYDTSTAVKHLATAPVLSTLLAITSQKMSTDVGAKASEALARIVAADEGHVGERESVLAQIFTLTLQGDVSQEEHTAQLIEQFLANEVVVHASVAQGICYATTVARRDADVAARWLRFVKKVAVENGALALELISVGALGHTTALMDVHVSNSALQLFGIEAMSGLVGDRLSGLQAFASENGVSRIETAMRTHQHDVVLLTKGVRALASGVSWPSDIQRASGYNYIDGLELTKQSMAAHGSDLEAAELQIAGLEALSKYVSCTSDVDQVKLGGGEGLVKAAMTVHRDNPKVQNIGRIVLDGIGSDRSWVPRGAQ